jgi:hypothetical protein
MRRYRLTDLQDVREGHFLQGLLDGTYLCEGGLGFKKPGERTHTADGPDGSDRHVHEDCEVFIILQGKAEMDIDGERHPLTTGDICIVEPGEDHHLIADPADPCVNVWLHAGEARHPLQRERA